ncbi:MFS transporter [Nocardioides sp. Kera G14]|uniref:MFS transporter n=1 Tax=Nocardioides sp. Kera G14 TaxID=2884264 RepID=UPI001D103C05|nr:MFS transporter [Nocardioides sp. Kera G14]UDY23173.1 MFS transporter [Nocardioides sp. Kera G14]
MTTVVTPPRAPVTRGWTTLFSLIWLGVWLAWLVPIQLALPDQLSDLVPEHKVLAFGLINGVGGLVSIFALPVFGALCDRTRSRLGRRHVWTAAGVAVFVVGLVLCGAAGSVVVLGAGWVVVTLGYTMINAGLTAVIADEVPESQRGLVSAAIYGPQAVGIIVGLVIVSGLSTSPRYLVTALLLLAFALPYLLRHRDLSPLPSGSSLSWRAVAAGLWISPRTHPDFAWGFGGRLLVNTSNALGTTELFFFLKDGLGQSESDANQSLIVLTLVYLVFTLTATYAGGLLSDRTGRRRFFVALAVVLQAVAGFLLAFWPSMGTAVVTSALTGAGYGMFMAVDQALITAVLPDAADRAKDLGIMNIGSVGPQAFGPLVAVGLITVGGYGWLFGMAGVLAVVGALMVYRIKSVP